MRLRSAGRGTGYSPARGVTEAVLGWLYAGGWAANAWARVPGTTAVLAHRHVLPVLPEGARPLRVGYASDLHIGPTTPPILLERAAEILAEARLDVLLLGGDYVYLDTTETTARTLRAFVLAIPARRTLAVLGNHDLWTDHERLEAALVEAGAELIVNRAVRVDGVAFLGLDDPRTGTPEPDLALAGCGDAEVRIALVHSPDGLPLLAGRVAALLCGHTHGGQLALPGYRTLYAPGPAGKRWPHGRHEVDGTTLLVSRGLGGVEIPMRTWAPPDVLIVDLVAR